MSARDPQFVLKTVNGRYVDYIKASVLPKKEPERWNIIQHPVPQSIPQHDPITTDDILSHL